MTTIVDGDHIGEQTYRADEILYLYRHKIICEKIITATLIAAI